MENVDLDKFSSTVLQHEMIDRDVSLISCRTNNISFASETVKFDQNKYTGSGKQNQSNSNFILIKDCKYCANNHAKNKCPAYGKVCAYSQRKHPFQIRCRKGIGIHKINSETLVIRLKLLRKNQKN